MVAQVRGQKGLVGLELHDIAASEGSFNVIVCKISPAIKWSTKSVRGRDSNQSLCESFNSKRNNSRPSEAQHTASFHTTCALKRCLQRPPQPK